MLYKTSALTTESSKMEIKYKREELELNSPDEDYGNQVNSDLMYSMIRKNKSSNYLNNSNKAII